MSEEDHDAAGERESPLIRNGGVGLGPPPPVSGVQPETGDEETIPVYDGGVGFPPHGDSRSWSRSSTRHPPLHCPNPG